MRIVWAGESVGTVCPLSGEGIATSVTCADILADMLKERLPGRRLEEIAQGYEKRLLSEFDWMDKQFTFLYAVRYGERASQLFKMLRLRIPHYMCARFSRVNVLFNWLHTRLPDRRNSSLIRPSD